MQVYLGLTVLSGQGKGRLLHLAEVTDAKENTTIRDVLESKHPSVYPECLNTHNNSLTLWMILLFTQLPFVPQDLLDLLVWLETFVFILQIHLFCSITILARRLYFIH